MVQIPILSGITTDEASDFRTSYPVNMVPVPKATGISEGYLRPSEGIESFARLPGFDRGGYVWDGLLYRAAGKSFVKVGANGDVTSYGEPFADARSRAIFANSFDRLAIAVDEKLFYFDGSAVAQVTDADLGPVKSMVWVDGYFMTTDGSFIVVTELNDPFSVVGSKYAASELDPDPIKALKVVNREVCALNRYTGEFFQNVGGNGFPFRRIDGAQLRKGVLGPHCVCDYSGGLAFLGSGRDEAIAVHFVSGGNTTKISDREIDRRIRSYSEAALADAVLERRSFDAHEFLYLRLPGETWVYDVAASRAVDAPVWHRPISDLLPGSYRALNFNYCYDKWICGDDRTRSLGVMRDDIGSQYGERVGWQFNVPLIFNNGMGAIVHSLELIGLTGRMELGDDPTVWTSYSLDGETYSQERAASAGRQGERAKRVKWLRNGKMRNFRTQKFRGTSDARLSVARLEAELEALNA